MALEGWPTPSNQQDAAAGYPDGIHGENGAVVRP
jgi:hypothetical protein